MQDHGLDRERHQVANARIARVVQTLRNLAATVDFDARIFPVKLRVQLIDSFRIARIELEIGAVRAVSTPFKSANFETSTSPVTVAMPWSDTTKMSSGTAEPRSSPKSLPSTASIVLDGFMRLLAHPAQTGGLRDRHRKNTA